MWKNKNSQTFRSFAKINLYLEITSTRPDGFHELITDFHTIDLHDKIIITPAKTTSLKCDHPDVPTDESNLALKALRLIEHETGNDLPVEITIEKRIPVAGGLGGGSSNAATVLFGINQILQEQLPIQKLHSVAAELGSDVPFFLYGGYMRGQGRGEVLQPLSDIEPLDLILVVPDFGVSAAEAYRQYDMLSVSPENEAGPGSVLRRNDLEEGVFHLFPRIDELKKQLLAEGCETVMMSGSGSTIIGKLTNETITAKIEFQNKDDVIVRTVTLNREQFKARQIEQ